MDTFNTQQRMKYIGWEGSSVSDPNSLNPDPDPDPAKNINPDPDPERP